MIQLFRAEILAATGRLDEARALLGSRTEQDTTSIDDFVTAYALSLEVWLLLLNGELTIERLDSDIERVRSAGQRTPERRLWQIAGEWHLSLGDHAAAIEAFSNAIEMARVVGQRDLQSEALRGVSLALLGHKTEADQIATALVAERDPPHIALARLFLALNQHDKARVHARTGYAWAWADGPPHCRKWELEACRSVLRELDEPEPVLPPYDPGRIPPLPHEAEIRRILDERRKERTT
jgi:tetratricopeptide (TPR) repeat protein